MSDRVSGYMHHGGQKGRDRLAIMSGVLAPATTQFFNRVGSMEGWTVVDAGCGSGDVALSSHDALGRAAGSSASTWTRRNCRSSEPTPSSAVSRMSSLRQLTLEPHRRFLAPIWRMCGSS